MAIVLLAFGPCVVILNCLGQVLYLGRAPRTKETLPDFCEWCRVTWHPRVFRGLTSCQRTPRIWSVTKIGFLVVLLDPDSNLPVFVGDIEKRGLHAVSVTFNLVERANN